MAAAVVGFIGNEWVARYRSRTRRMIGSAALVADGLHARTAEGAPGTRTGYRRPGGADTGALKD